MNMSIGTKIGAVAAHCADDEPKLKLINAQIKIKPIKTSGPVKLNAW